MGIPSLCIAAALVAPQVKVEDAEDGDAGGGRAFLEIYDVHDLVSPSRGRAPLDDSSSAETDAEPRAFELVALLARAATSGLAAPEGCSFDSKPGGALVVRGPEVVQRRVDRMLKELRQPGGATVVVELRLFELDAAQRARFAKGDAKEAVGADAAEAVETAVLTLPPEQAAELARSAKSMQSPRISTFPLQPFEAFTGDEISYVAGLEQVSIEGIGTIADPVVKQIRDGVTVRGRAVAVAGAEGEKAPCALRLEIEVTALKRPIEQQKCDLGVLQLPEVKRATIATTVAGRVRTPFLVGGVPKPTFDAKEGDRRLYALVTVDLVPREEESRREK
jgi:hypothetical protein